MGKTKRQASNWWERKFKYGDPQYPDPDYADHRYQNKIRNQNRSYYCEKIDPLSMKIVHWREYGKWTKTNAKRVARHNAKLLVKKLSWEIIQEEVEEQLAHWKEFYEWNYEYDLQCSVKEYWDDRLQEEQESLYGFEEESYFDYDYDWDHDWDHEWGYH